MAAGLGVPVGGRRGPFWSASEAAIPNVAGPELTTWANSLLGASRSAGITIGPALGGALLAILSPTGVFAANAVSFVVSALIVVSVRARFSGERGARTSSTGSRPGSGSSARPVLRTLLLAWLVFISGMGMSMVADAPLALEFEAGAFGFGLLVTRGVAHGRRLAARPAHARGARGRPGS